MKKKIAIIGAGIAGVSAALRLHKRGYAVTVYEKNSYIGGKMNQFVQDGYRWDTGPSVFTLPHLLVELYELYGKKTEDYMMYEKQEHSCFYFFNDGTTFTFYTDLDKLAKEAETKLGVRPEVMLDYLAACKEKYEVVGTMFLENPIHKISLLPWDKVRKALPFLITGGIFKSLDALNKRDLKDEKLIKLFNRYATYNGSNPYEASSILSMIAHLDQTIGTFYPKGGMRRIVGGLYDLAQEQEIDFLLNQTIESCKRVGNQYEIKSNGDLQKFDKVVSAIDHLQFYKHILKDEKLYKKYKKQERSASAFIFYWGMNQSFEALDLHNIFFSKDYKEEFHTIFKDLEVPMDPTIYINITSKCDPEDAPAGGENWFVMVNVPAGKVFSPALTAKLRAAIITKLEKALKRPVESAIVTEKTWFPEKIAQDTGSYMGALYGAAQNTKTAAITRHPNHSTTYKDLYFCGGTVHPGGGVPVSIQSAKIVDKLIEHEH
ncbi:MAG: Phytoene desaturase, neurosporene or lycopene producing (EC / 4,4'-diapolycopene oxidase [uncultured Aureispira sp.]|uniref:Phytoene desaturase, neurosporene or lycopene producing n=1 Tax=uncultured Aureispira sp. TaxID=1331704 RepID=A0A6S6UCT8_9BACT|nr:MAG: Phytoene desaturase, neurosporene or lycopene producing (EC / 4,4'-diapolycopene oxidase [uncultured Aureispira sp.]